MADINVVITNGTTSTGVTVGSGSPVSVAVSGGIGPAAIISGTATTAIGVSQIAAGANVTVTTTSGTYTVSSYGQVASVQGRTGNVVLTVSDFSAAPTTHTHTTTQVVGFTSAVQALAPVASVQSKTGAVVLSASDVSAVASINSLRGPLTLAAGSNISISTSGTTITIAGASGLPSASSNPGLLLSDGSPTPYWGKPGDVVPTILAAGTNVILTDPGNGGPFVISAATTPLSSATPSALGAASAGSSTAASRSDHVHLLPTVSQISAAAATHTHSYVSSVNGITGTPSIVAGANVTISTTGTAITVSATGGGTSGVSLSSATPLALGAAASGSSSLASRDDHVHPIVTVSQISAAAATHTHSYLQSINSLTGTPSIVAGTNITISAAGTAITVSAAGAGTSGISLSSATPVSLGVASGGTGTLASRDDHVHPLVTVDQISAAAATHSHSYVQSVNGLTGSPSIIAGANVTVSASGTAVIVSATGGGSGVTLSSATPLALGVASAGSSTLASRDDHIHPVVTISQISAASATHSHGYVQSLNSLTGTPSIVAGANITVSAAGTAVTVTGATPGASLGSAAPLPPGVAVAGAGTAASREDHVHALPTFSQISAASSTHTHGYVTSLNSLTGGLTIAVAGSLTAAASGSTVTLSAPAVFPLGSAAPLSLGVASAGAGTAASREDHTHLLPTVSQISAASVSSVTLKVSSDTSGVTAATQIVNMVKLTTAQYSAITPNTATLYIIVG